MRRSLTSWRFISLTLLSGAVIAVLVAVGGPLVKKTMVPKAEPTFAFQHHLERVYPLKVDQKIIAIVIMERDDLDYKRTLDSIFDQVYSEFEVVCVGNGISSSSFKTVAEHIHQRQKEQQTVLTHYEKAVPELEILYEAIHQCAANDIIVPVRGGDWLAHEYVLDHLNRAYAHPDVWMTYSRSLNFPDYSDIKGVAHVDAAFTEKCFRYNRRLTLEGLKSFYAGFFQTIRLQDFLFRGSFINDAAELAFIFPLLEMGPEHVLFLAEVAYIKRQRRDRHASRSWVRDKQRVEAYLRSLPLYATIHHWKRAASQVHRYNSDVIIFSADRPLQLYATLESLRNNISDTSCIRVIYEASDSIFERAYLEIEAAFPAIEFLAVCDYPTNTFNHLLMQVLAQKRAESPYLCILDDQVVIKEKVPLHRCIRTLEKVRADHFIIDYEPEAIDEKALPVACRLEGKIVAKQIETSVRETLNGISLCRKSLFSGKEWQQVETLGAFKRLWRNTIAAHSVALFFNDAKRVAPLVGAAFSKERQREWAYQFIEGFKIDLASLLCEAEVIEEGVYPLIKRQRNRKLARR